MPRNRIVPDEAVKAYFLAHYFTNIARYATRAFLRAKLGRVLFGRAINILDTTFEEAGAPYGSANRP